MNDKTEQSATDEPRGTAAGGRAEIINVPGYPLMVRAVDYNTLYAQLAELSTENERLREQRNRIGLCIDRALNGSKKDDHEAGLSGRMDAIRALRAQLAEAQRDSERLDLLIEQRAYVVSDPDCCDGYWLNYLRPDGTVWTQATAHETPRAAIDAAKGEPS